MARQTRWTFILFVLVFGAALTAWFDFQGFYARPVAFDKKLWMHGRDAIKQANDPGCVLGGMALHLKQTNRLTLIPYQELYLLLGQPDSGVDKAFAWDIGQCHDGGWVNSQLMISLDTNGRVKDVSFQESK